MRLSRSNGWLIPALAILAGFAGPGRAKVAPAVPARLAATVPAIMTPADVAAAADVDHVNIALQFIYANLRARTLGDADLKARLAEIPPLRARLAGAAATLSPHLRDTEASLAQLGPPPPPGQPAEDPETTANRAALTRLATSLTAESKQARLLSVEADQLDHSLDNRLRGNFSARLWARERSMIDPTLWSQFRAALPADLANTGRRDPPGSRAPSNRDCAHTGADFASRARRRVPDRTGALPAE